MTFTESISTCFSKYADFTGRATRSEFWWFLLFYNLVSVPLHIVGFVLENWYPAAELLISAWLVVQIVFELGILIPNLAVSVRRLHDTNHRGWWLLIVFIPIIGIILLLIWWIKRGDEGPNRFDAVAG